MNRDTTLYGVDLATEVADFLQAGGYIANDHRDYCGLGLVYDKEHFLYASVNDGYCFYIVKAFPTRAEFIDWLAAQSDDALSGKEEANEWLRDNQRITRKKLENLPHANIQSRDCLVVLWDEYK